jgi:hypothetical protein
MATRWGIASAGKISHDFVNALATYGDNSGHKVDFYESLFRPRSFRTDYFCTPVFFICFHQILKK